MQAVLRLDLVSAYVYMLTAQHCSVTSQEAPTSASLVATEGMPDTCWSGLPNMGCARPAVDAGAWRPAGGPEHLITNPKTLARLVCGRMYCDYCC